MRQIERLDLEEAFNFRDIGGYPVAEGRVLLSGRVFRADGLNRLTDTDLEVLKRLGLRVVVDLRETREREANPDRVNALDVRQVAVPLHNDEMHTSEGWNATSIEEQYEAYAGRYAHRLAEALMEILEADGPVVVHCSAGKDRTGVVFALLLTLLGVGEDVVAAVEMTL